VWWASILLILGFLRLSNLELSRGTGQTYGRTPRPILECPLLYGEGHNKCNSEVGVHLTKLSLKQNWHHIEASTVTLQLAYLHVVVHRRAELSRYSIV